MLPGQAHQHGHQAADNEHQPSLLVRALRVHADRPHLGGHAARPLHVALLGATDHAIGTLSPCQIARMNRRTVEEPVATHPRIVRGLPWAALVDEGTPREWIVGLGRRPADQRLAHLLCELLDKSAMTPGTRC